jgi:predicted ATP-grasp superfamily ATP-dependent carboligase
MAANPIRVLVLGGEHTQSLPVMKALRQAGHYVTVLSESRLSFGHWSRLPHRRALCPRCETNPDGYLDFLLRFLRDDPHDVTIPLFDDTASVTSRHKAELGRYTRVPVPDWDVFRLAYDKSETMRLCARVGVPHPKTWDPRDQPLETIAREAAFPCIVKPNVGHGAIGIRRVAGPDALPAAYGETCRRFGPAVVQELIPQTGMQYKAQVFRGPDGTIHAAVVFSKPRYFPVTGGTSSLNVTVDRPDIVAQCVRLLGAMNWESQADADLIEDPRDGQIKLMEINPRITGSIKIAFEAGVDFADLLVRHALGRPLPTFDRYRVGLQMRYMPLDILWFLYSPDRWRARPSWFRFFGKDLCYQEGSLDDPLPAAAGFLSGFLKYLNPQFRKEKLGAGS